MKLDKLRDDIKNGQLNSMNNYIVSFKKDIFNFLFFVGCSEGCSGSSCAKRLHQGIWAILIPFSGLFDKCFSTLFR